jgi:ubiquinone/menaquinone biosynthesis C-methylase UbiE
MQEPSQRQIGLQNRLERERAREEHQITKADNVEFWRDYLDQFHYIVNFTDYWQLLDHVYRLMGKLQGGERILDAGCGNGNFGMFVLINHTYRCRNGAGSGPKRLRYVGVDFVQEALVKARGNLVQLSKEIAHKSGPNIQLPSAMESSLACADLNMALPFEDNQFDRIICNLVIGYVHDPLRLLHEFMRVLAPGGKLVITNLKPHADLSQIYRNFVQNTEQLEEVEEARRLLNNSGKIKQGESEGIFRFFDRQELMMLLLSSGAVQPRIYSTFANQAYIAVVEKGNIRGSEIVNKELGSKTVLAMSP